MIVPHTLPMFLDYDPETGIFTWRERHRKYFSSDRAQSVWNAQNAGKVCGRICDGYRRIRIFGSEYLAHRIAWTMMTGEWPVGEIDHINGHRDDNRAVNIRLVSHEINARNRPIHTNNISGHPGVYEAADGRWYAQIHSDGKRRHLGRFSTFDEAKSARECAEAAHGYLVRSA